MQLPEVSHRQNADLLGENTRVGAIEASTEFTQAMLPALERAVDHE